MTLHYLTELLRARCAKFRALAGEPPIDLASTPDSEIIDCWNNTDADCEQGKLSPRQLSRAIARCETLEEFDAILRCPALADGAYLMFRPGQSAVLMRLLDKRYFMPPAVIDELTAMAAADDDYDMCPVWKRYIRRRCRSFFQQHQIVDFDILLTYQYWADE